MPNTTLKQYYQELISKGKITTDNEQKKTIEILDDYFFILKNRVQPVSLFSKIASIFDNCSKTALPSQVVYIYGDVGRGKSMIMDLFFEEAIKSLNCQRLHFHEFMNLFHQTINQIRKTSHDESNIFKEAVKRILGANKVICFDEMQVKDIADAMIIGRIFEAFFEAGIFAIITSNRHPKELYKDGLNRDRFEPFIQKLISVSRIICLNGEVDYRLSKSLAAIAAKKSDNINSLKIESYKLVKNEHEELEYLAQILAKLYPHEQLGKKVLSSYGREIIIENASDKVAFLEFRDFFKRALGTQDYLEIAENFELIILKHIPQLGLEEYNMAIRFINFIDALYERKTKLIATASVKPDNIYIEGESSFEFKRTTSRLHEMSSWV